MSYRSVEGWAVSLLRWLLVPVALAATWLALLFGCLLVVAGLELCCPEDQRISDSCAAPWFGFLTEVLFIGAQLLYGFLWVLLGSLVAPVRSRRAAPALLLAGVLTVGLLLEEWWGPTMALAVTGGALALALLLWRSPRR